MPLAGAVRLTPVARVVLVARVAAERDPLDSGSPVVTAAELAVEVAERAEAITTAVRVHTAWSSFVTALAEPLVP